MPITIILDNAKYTKYDIVTELDSLLKINLIYLSSYSLNLNLIERLWKFIKNKALNGRYYSTLEPYIESIPKEYKSELDSLLTLKFQELSGNISTKQKVVSIKIIQKM